MSDFEKQMQRYITGELTPEERIAFEDDVLSNAELTDRLYSDASMRTALETAARARRERAVATATAEPWWRRGILRWLAPSVAVAAVAVFMFFQQTESPEQPQVFRGGEGQVTTFEPQGDVAAVPSRFVWSTSDDAAYYRFELFDAASTPVFETVTADTTVTIDPAATDAPAQGYWVVTPLNDLRVGAGDATLTRYKTVE